MAMVRVKRIKQYVSVLVRGGATCEYRIVGGLKIQICVSKKVSRCSEPMMAHLNHSLACVSLTTSFSVVFFVHLRD